MDRATYTYTRQSVLEWTDEIDHKCNYSDYAQESVDIYVYYFCLFIRSTPPSSLYVILLYGNSYLKGFAQVAAEAFLRAVTQKAACIIESSVNNLHKLASAVHTNVPVRCWVGSVS